MTSDGPLRLDCGSLASLPARIANLQKPSMVAILLHGLNCPSHIAGIVLHHLDVSQISILAKAHLFVRWQGHLLGHRKLHQGCQGVDLGNGHVGSDAGMHLFGQATIDDFFLAALFTSAMRLFKVSGCRSFMRARSSANRAFSCMTVQWRGGVSPNSIILAIRSARVSLGMMRTRREAWELANGTNAHS